MGTTLRQAWLETKLFVRGLDNLFWTLAFPVFFVVLYGLIYGDTLWEDAGMRAFEYTLPGVVVMALMVTGIMHTGIGFAEEREKGIYRRLSLTPLRPSAILGGQLLHRYALIFIQTCLLFVIGWLGFGARIVGNLGWIWLVVTAGSLCFLSIGFLLAGFVRSARAANGITMVVFFMFLLLGGVFFPSDMMPGFLATISRALPSTLVNTALREIMILGRGPAAVWRELAAVGGWFLVSFLVAIKRFRWE
jgi:ABC-2 type transport system permease protein